MAKMADAPVQMVFHQMNGQELQLMVCPHTAFEDVTKELVTLITPSDSNLHARISSDGEIITSIDDLLNLHHSGIPIQVALQRDPQKMQLAEVAQELAMEHAEFRGHRFTLSRLPIGSTPRDVAEYLRSNNVLLTAEQAADLFDILVTKLRPSDEVHFNLRGQLVMALHTFCLEPNAIWEPDDGNGECVWGNMTYNGNYLNSGRYKFRGEHCLLAKRTAASSDLKDVMNLRAVLRARRQGMEDDLSLLSLLKTYNTPILPEPSPRRRVTADRPCLLL